MDKISIITVTYNCVKDIEKTIVSVLEQDYPNIEYIIIDGASTDGTIDIIKKYSEQIYYWTSEPDNGIYYAMNKGIDVATGDWVLMFNAGDELCEKNTISKMFANDFSQVDVCYGDFYNVLEDGIKYEKVVTPFYENTKKLHGMGFGHQSVFVRTSWAKRYKFDTSFKCCADYNQMVTLYKNGAKFKYIDLPIEIAEGRYGFSENNRHTQMLEEARICGIEGTIWFKLYRVNRWFRTCIKKYIYIPILNVLGE